MPSRPSIDQLYTSIDQGIFGFILRDPALFQLPAKLSAVGHSAVFFAYFFWLRCALGMSTGNNLEPVEPLWTLYDLELQKPHDLLRIDPNNWDWRQIIMYLG